MHLNVTELVVVETGPSHLGVIQWKAQWLNKMQPGPRVCAETNDIARVGRNLRLNKNDIEVEWVAQGLWVSWEGIHDRDSRVSGQAGSARTGQDHQAKDSIAP